MSIQEVFHFPPALTALLIDTIPLLCKSKKDVLLFFKGAGVPELLMKDYIQKVQTNRDKIFKHEIARGILTRLNEKGDKSQLTGQCGFTRYSSRQSVPQYSQGMAG